MKKIQVSALVMPFLCVAMTCSTTFAQKDPSPKLADMSAVAPDYRSLGAGSLAKADSLFKIKQFTQSFELYRELFEQKKYSPAMLLKMAYIQEGLGHLSLSLYFMNLYYKVSHDQQALVKIEEMATRNKLEGYEASESRRIFSFLQVNHLRITAIISSLLVLLLALALYLKRKTKNVLVLTVLQVFFLAVLLVHINFLPSPEQGIVAHPATYLMSGPSAGASVVSIIGEGHQLEILGQRDVWLKVRWMEKDAYVKRSAVLE